LTKGNHKAGEYPQTKRAALQETGQKTQRQNPCHEKSEERIPKPKKQEKKKSTKSKQPGTKKPPNTQRSKRQYSHRKGPSPNPKNGARNKNTEEEKSHVEIWG